MPHALPRTGAAVHDEPKSGRDKAGLSSELVGREDHSVDHEDARCIEISHRFDMLRGNDEQVSWSLGMDIFERQHIGLFVDDFRWDLTFDDPTEEARAHPAERRSTRSGRLSLRLAFSRFLFGCFPAASLAVELPVTIVPLLFAQTLTAGGAGGGSVGHGRFPRSVLCELMACVRLAAP